MNCKDAHLLLNSTLWGRCSHPRWSSRWGTEASGWAVLSGRFVSRGGTPEHKWERFHEVCFLSASSSMNHQIICPLCHDGLPFKHSRWPNVGYISHSTRGQSHPMNILKRHTSPSQLAFACFETSTNVDVFSSTQILYANQNDVLVCLCHLS